MEGCSQVLIIVTIVIVIIIIICLCTGKRTRDNFDWGPWMQDHMIDTCRDQMLQDMRSGMPDDKARDEFQKCVNQVTH